MRPDENELGGRAHHLSIHVAKKNPPHTKPNKLSVILSIIKKS